MHEISYNQLFLLLIGMLLIGLVSIFIFMRLKKNAFRRKVKRAIKKISCDYIADIPLDMGEDHYAYFDYILLYRQGIMALEIKDYAGHIYASDKINEWTQVINRKSYKFKNPFFILEQKIDLIKEIIPDQPITVVIIFTEQADFPKGRPDNVLLISELYKHYGKANANDAPADIMANWNQLKKYLLQQGHS